MEKKQNKIVKYFKDSYEELKKVKWPTRNEAINNTILVIVICVFMGLFLGLIDLGLTELIYKLLNIAK